jgi:hypothetical protein
MFASVEVPSRDLVDEEINFSMPEKLTQAES